MMVIQHVDIANVCSMVTVSIMMALLLDVGKEK